MGMMTSQITSLTIVYSVVYSDADQRKYQSSVLLAFVGEFTGDRWIPRQMASNPENVSIWWCVIMKGYFCASPKPIINSYAIGLSEVPYSPINIYYRVFWDIMINNWEWHKMAAIL